MAEAKRAVRELEGDFPVAGRKAFGGMGVIDEVGVRAVIDRVDRRMDHPSHQVVADDVVIDGRQCAAGAQEALVGGTELTVWPCVAFMAANDIDEPVVQQREQCGELRHDGVIVIARIGDQRFGEGDADTCDAAIDAGDVFGPGPCYVAKRAPGRGLIFLPAHSPEPQLGAPVVVRCVECIDVWRSDRAAAIQRVQPKRRAARVRGPSAEAARDRKRDRRMHEVVRNELQQIGIPGRYQRVFPVLCRSVAM